MEQMPSWGANTEQVQCDLCNVTLYSEVHAKRHFTGRAHNNNVEAQRYKQQSATSAPTAMHPPYDYQQTSAPSQYAATQDAQWDNSYSANTPAQFADSQYSSWNNPAAPPAAGYGEYDQGYSSWNTGPTGGVHYDQYSTYDASASSAPQFAPSIPACAYNFTSFPAPEKSQSAAPAAPTVDACFAKALAAGSISTDDAAAPVKKRRVTIPCTLCDCIFNSQADADIHFSGSKHKKKLALAPDMTKKETYVQMVPCTVCKISFNSDIQAKAHFTSSKHLKKEQEAKKIKQAAPIATANPPGNSKTVQCAACKVNFNSQSQADLHFASAKHIVTQARADMFVTSSTPSSLPDIVADTVKRFSCDTCSVTVNNQEAYEQHCQSETHKTNMAAPSGIKANVGMRAFIRNAEPSGKMNQWAQGVPGQFTGKASTGVKTLSIQELSPMPHAQAWAKKEQLKTCTAIKGGIGMALLQKMGWNQGEGLGKNRDGTALPLMLDIKNDRKGLLAADEAKKSMTPKTVPSGIKTNLSGKHPVSALVELCSKRRWKSPEFIVVNEAGPDHQRHFMFKVRVNNWEYQPTTASNNKKLAKAEAAAVCLQELGLLPRP